MITYLRFLFQVEFQIKYSKPFILNFVYPCLMREDMEYTIIFQTTIPSLYYFKFPSLGRLRSKIGIPTKHRGDQIISQRYVEDLFSC